jgi:hypothetical protein
MLVLPEALAVVAVLFPVALVTSALLLSTWRERSRVLAGTPALSW